MARTLSWACFLMCKHVSLSIHITTQLIEHAFAAMPFVSFAIFESCGHGTMQPGRPLACCAHIHAAKAVLHADILYCARRCKWRLGKLLW